MPAGRAVVGAGNMCIQGVMSSLGIMTITVGVVLISDVIYTMSAIIIPAISDVTATSGQLLLASFSAVSFGVYFNYYLACATDPGDVPKSYVDTALAQLQSDMEQGARRASIPRCSSCRTPKPPRTHHCSLCGRCVLKMDHHCPWVNGCVGYHNQRYFVAFLLYLFAGTWYCLVALAHVCWFHGSANAAALEELCQRTQVTFTFVLVGSINVAMFFFVGWNLYMALTNQTSIEFQLNSWERGNAAAAGVAYRSPYDLGRLRNLVEIFGDAPLRCFGRCCVVAARKGGIVGIMWLLAPSLMPLPGDGTRFDTFESYSEYDSNGSGV